MASPDDPVQRIADALERLSPRPPSATDWGQAPAFVWNGVSARPVARMDALDLATLRGIDEQKAAVHENLRRLAVQTAAHDMLLWGARGMGKSALVRAAVADVQTEFAGALTLIQLESAGISSIAALLESLEGEPQAFLLFLDDLGFGSGQAQDNLALRSLLDGGVTPRPANVRLAVTSNRRAIIARDQSEAEALHARDERDDALALADRFGLSLGFHPCDRATYLAILHAYTDPAGLTFDDEEALTWAMARGNQSGRAAHQFAVELAGRSGKVL